jgi:hypothetical protein
MSKTIKFEVKETEYKGSPTLTFTEHDEGGKEKPFGSFSLGVKKLKAIMQHEEEVRKFLEGK